LEGSDLFHRHRLDCHCTIYLFLRSFQKKAIEENKNGPENGPFLLLFSFKKYKKRGMIEGVKFGSRNNNGMGQQGAESS